MRFRCLPTVTSLTLAMMIALAASSPAQESKGWAQFRGPLARGMTSDFQLPGEDFGLEVAWRHALGSGYSNVSIADGKAITMFTDGELDVIGGFDLESGKEVWRYELGPKYAGHDGSDDGPIGTPTISDSMVYALGPAGQLVALALADGEEKWRTELNEENSTVPLYGYAASPVVTDSQVIVTTGGEGHAVTAFDRLSGEIKWTQGDDSVSYQTPMVVKLRGRVQLLTVTNQFLYGLDPESGDVLWESRHTEGEQTEDSAHPTSVDDERFLVKYWRGSRLYRVVDGGVEEVWVSRAFGNTYALPVLVGEHFYGFTGGILTCVSVETGEIAWRSRQPGGLGLSVVGGLLAIASPGGDLVLVEPSPEGYVELTRVAVLQNGSYSIPSFADGLFLIRNLEQMAAVRINPELAPQVAQIDLTDRLRGELGQWIAAVEAKPLAERQVAVESRFADGEVGPVFEAGGITHVLWRGAATDVGVRGDLVEGGLELGLFRVEGTDLFFRSLKLDPKAQYTYDLMVDFGDPQPDAGNPHSVDLGFRKTSELRMPEWPASPHLDPPATEAARGTLDGFPFRSDILENTREIKVWRPAAYGQNPDTRYPLLVVNHGDNLLRGSLMENTLNNLVGTSVEPLIAVFVPRSSGAEYGGADAEKYNRFLIEELLPHLDRHYRTDSTRRAIMGPGSAGVAAMFAAVHHPESFQRVATQSFYPIEPANELLPELIAEAEPKLELVYVVWSRHDYVLGNGVRAADTSRELIGQLQRAGVKVTEQVADYSPGWGGWRGQHDEVLAALFPMPSVEVE